MRFGVRYAVVEAILVGEVENVAIAVYWLLWCPAPSLDGASSRVPNKVGRGTIRRSTVLPSKQVDHARTMAAKAALKEMAKRQLFGQILPK